MEARREDSEEGGERAGGVSLVTSTKASQRASTSGSIPKARSKPHRRRIRYHPSTCAAARELEWKREGEGEGGRGRERERLRVE